MVGPLYGSTIKFFNGMTNKPFFLTVYCFYVLFVDCFFENSRLACADFVTNQKQAHRKNGKTLAARKKHYEVRDAVRSLNYLAVFGTKLLTIYY